MSWFRSKRKKEKTTEMVSIPLNVSAPISVPTTTVDRSEPITFTGNYPTWESAAALASGYDSKHILEKTRAALLKVKNKEAIFERDSVLFDKIEHSFPLLAGLLRAALLNNGRLVVADFGGSLGSTYFQCREFLQGVSSIEWNIIEQAAHVECGRRDFETSELHFYFNIKELPETPNVLLLANVLAYLPNPYEVLKELLSHGCGHLLIDDVSFLKGSSDRLTVQSVPEYIYKATYPAWFLNEAKLVGLVESYDYMLLSDYDCKYSYSPDGGVGYCKGFIYEKRRSI